MRRLVWHSLLGLVWLLHFGVGFAAEPTIRTVTDIAGKPVAIEATGLSAELLADESAWANALGVYVGGSEAVLIRRPCWARTRE